MRRVVANLGRRVSVVAWIMTGLSALSCSGGTLAQNQQASQVRVKVVSTSSIIGDWARQVGGDGVRVVDLIPAGADPHTFSPGARDIANLSDADLVLFVGLNLEGPSLMKTIANVASDGVGQLALGPLADPAPPSLSGDGPADADEEFDPHFWMDPIRAKVIASAIAEELARIDAVNGDQYRDNAKAYLQRLDDLDSWIIGKFEDLTPEDRLIVASHDSLGYFASRYGFRVVGAVIPGVTTERDPSADEMASLVDTITKIRPKAIFTETTISDRMSQRISEETGVPIVGGLTVGALGPVGSDTGTYEGMMRRNVEIIREALR